MPTLDMRPEHWARLRQMARKAEPRLESSEIETLTHSDEILAMISARQNPVFDRSLIEKYVPRLKK